MYVHAQTELPRDSASYSSVIINGYGQTISKCENKNHMNISITISNDSPINVAIDAICQRVS
jgi:hypothetical protein